MSFHLREFALERVEGLGARVRDRVLDLLGKRLVVMEGGLRLWKVILTAQGYDMDAQKTAAHFDIPAWKAQAAFHYYEAFPQEIEDAIADTRAQTFDTLKRKLPQIERHEITVAAADVAAPVVESAAKSNKTKRTA